MKRRTIITVAMLATILMAASGADFAYARGGGGGAGGGAGGGGKASGIGSGTGLGSMNQSQATYRNQHQNTFQHRYRSNQDENVQSSGTSPQKDQIRSGLRMQLRDPSTHDRAAAE